MFSKSLRKQGFAQLGTGIPSKIGSSILGQLIDTNHKVSINKAFGIIYKAPPRIQGYLDITCVQQPNKFFALFKHRSTSKSGLNWALNDVDGHSKKVDFSVHA